MLVDEELAGANARFAGKHPSALIGWVLDNFAPARRVVVTGLQAEGIAITDMAISLDPKVRILTVDTGRLPSATHRYLGALRNHWHRDIEVVRPDPDEVGRFATEHGANAFRLSVPLRLECCHIRKVAPLERALRGVDCWMSGLTRAQSSERATTPLVQRDDRHGGIVKVNPLAGWSLDDARGYLRMHGVPEHPLYSRGYTSIGCAPCTRAVGPGQGDRSGRWWWEDGVDKECGIHATPRRVALGAS